MRGLLDRSAVIALALVVLAFGGAGCQGCDPEPYCPPDQVLDRFSERCISRDAGTDAPMGDTGTDAPVRDAPIADVGPDDAADAPIDRRRPPKHAVMLSNLDTDCTAVAGTIACTRTSAAANVIEAAAVTEAGFTTFDGATIFEDVTSWVSDAGASPIVLTTPRATVTATFGGGRYAITGLARPFLGAETLTVSAPSASPAVSPITLTAPSGPPRFGALAGLATDVLVEDGTFDVLFVYARDASGSSGVMVEVQAGDMALRGGDRVAPILDASLVAELAARGIVLDRVTVGPYARVWTSALFPAEEVPVQAGYLVDVPVAELSP